MNDAARQAIREFLVGSGREELFDEAVEEFRDRHRAALDNLKDM